MEAGFLTKHGDLIEVDKHRRKWFVLERELKLAEKIEAQRQRDAEGRKRKSGRRRRGGLAGDSKQDFDVRGGSCRWQLARGRGVVGQGQELVRGKSSRGFAEGSRIMYKGVAGQQV